MFYCIKSWESLDFHSWNVVWIMISIHMEMPVVSQQKGMTFHWFRLKWFYSGLQFYWLYNYMPKTEHYILANMTRGSIWFFGSKVEELGQHDLKDRTYSRLQKDNFQNHATSLFTNIRSTTLVDKQLKVSKTYLRSFWLFVLYFLRVI